MVVTHYGNQQYYGLSSDTKPVATDTAVNAIFGELDTGDQYINNGTAWVLQVGAGGGLSAGGQISFNGTAAQTVFNIPHGLAQTPDFISVQPASADAFGSFTRTKDATNIIITYQIPPPLGTANVTFQWGAGFVSEDIEIGLSSSSTTTLTNKTLNFSNNTFPYLATPTYYTVYKQTADSVVKCRDNITGTIVSSSATQEVPIQYAIDNSYRKSVFIASATYNFSAGFPGLVFPKNWTESRIYLDPGALLNVPQGYAGSCFVLQENSSLIKILGGKYSEQGTPGSLWKCFRLASDAASPGLGINSCTIGDCYVRFPARVISLESLTTNGWINSCIFRDIFADRFVRGIYFDQAVAKGPGNGANLNTFMNNIWQCSDAPATPVTLHGVRNIGGAANHFINNHVWDTPAGSISANLTTEATDTVIIGGKMTAVNFEDVGFNTVILDYERGMKFPTKGAFANQKLLQAPTGVTNNWGILTGNFAAGGGVLQSGITESGTAADNVVYADGLYRRYTTAGASGDNAGFTYGTNITFRGWYPYLETTFRLNLTSNVRLWIGWTSLAGEPAGDTPFASQSSVGVGVRAADTNFQLFRSSGAAMSITDSFAIAKDINIHTVKIMARDSLSAWNVFLDGVRVETVSTIPAQTTALRPVFQIESTDAVAKSIDRFGFYVNPGKNTHI